MPTLLSMLIEVIYDYHNNHIIMTHANYTIDDYQQLSVTTTHFNVGDAKGWHLFKKTKKKKKELAMKRDRWKWIEREKNKLKSSNYLKQNHKSFSLIDVGSYLK